MTVMYSGGLRRRDGGLGQPQAREQEERDDRAITRGGLLRRAQQRALLIEIERAGCRSRQLLATHDCRAEAERAEELSVAASAWLTDAGPSARLCFVCRL